MSYVDTQYVRLVAAYTLRCSRTAAEVDDVVADLFRDKVATVGDGAYRVTFRRDWAGIVMTSEPLPAA